ncbi:MAG: Dihydrolipoamide acetyltransferase component of pyruvate dehydrogenase complex [Verrucomicrobiales bacterium]|nr:Dihydrolipoamide acetyltransferase component of pyruvate dehydrogenase complex [Verrucomicrobiales bacterium]
MDVKLPPLGEGADSGVVVSILVKEGDTVKKGQTILELESGKAVAPIPSSASGKVTKILVKEGAKISVGALLISVEVAAGEDKAAPATKPTAATPKKATLRKQVEEAPADEEEESEEAESDSQFPPPASPSLRRLAVDLGINLKKIRGSENGGRIVLADLKTYIQKLEKLARQPKTQANAQTGPVASKPAAPQVDFAKYGPVTRKPMSGLRKVISQRMTENWNAIPHVTQFEEVDITHLMELRKKFTEAYEKAGARLTLTSFALKAVASALKKHPSFNASLDESTEEIVFKDYVHIGLAVDTDQGLIVPVIRDVDKKNLVQISKDVAELANKTRDRKVSMEELQGGSFTISNQGGIGGNHFTPIINRPEVAILGIGKGSLKPIVTKEMKIEARLMLPIALSYDHRVIDGGSAVRFILDVIQGFEGLSESDVKI